MATLSSPTLERLIKESRIFLNEQKKDNSFWSDEELTMYINDGVRLYFLEINDRAEGQFDKRVTLDVVAGSETVALPSDCFEVRTLMKIMTTENRMLKYDNNITQGYSTSSGGGSSSTYEPSYYFRGNSLVLHPTPDFSETAGLQLEYTAMPETLIVGGDVLGSGISPVFKELIVMYTVWKAKVKEDLVMGGSNSDRAGMHLAQVYTKFKESVGGRSKHPTFTKPFNP